MSLIRKGLVTLLLVVFVLAVLGVWLGADALFARALRSGGSAALGAPVDFEDSDLALFSGSAQVSGFFGGTEEHPLLAFRDAVFDVGVGAALAGRTELEMARIDGLRIHLVVEEDGRLSWDPGPPPPEAEKAPDAPAPPPDAEPLPPPEERDLVQIVREYWERYQTYQGYYQEYGGFLGGAADAEDQQEAARERVRWPGKPEAVARAQAEAAARREAQGSLWIAEAAIEDFAWVTRDARTGEPLLPDLASCSLRLLRVGTPPDSGSEPAELSGDAELSAGGVLSFGWQGMRDGTPDALRLSAIGLPVRELLPLAGSSFPFDVTEGRLGVVTEDLRFAADHLSGLVRLELADAKLAARADSPEVLGVAPGEFCSLLNAALGAQPVVFVIGLGGTPAAPEFTIENEGDIADALGGAVKAEVERRAREFVDEQTAELEQKAEEAKAELEQKADEKKEDLKKEATKRIGNLIGGGGD